jgi:hypothetical protein
VVLREKKDECNFGGSELNAVTVLEPGGLAACAVDEDAVTTTKILDEVTIIVVMNNCVLPRDLRVGKDEVTVRLPTDGERERIDGDST